jgi:hypothetical protein
MHQGKAPTRVCLLALALLCYRNECLAADSVSESLDRIDSRKFVRAVIGPMSGTTGVEFAALDTPEIQTLLKNREQAVPQMLQRFTTPDGIQYGPARIIYLIVFAKIQDARIIPALANYMDSLPESAGQQSISNRYNPFEYAMKASCGFVDCSSVKRKYKYDQLFRARREIAALLRATSSRRTK